jgi:hypothetical protein
MRYRIHRIKETPGESFRWAQHTGGEAIVKPKDYDPGEELEAPSTYAAWKLMNERGQALRPGDLLENLDTPSQPLEIAKYIGFEPAQWLVPDPKFTNSEDVDRKSSTVSVNPI